MTSISLASLTAPMILQLHYYVYLIVTITIPRLKNPVEGDSLDKHIHLQMILSNLLLPRSRCCYRQTQISIVNPITQRHVARFQ